jgi:hypothetical protein
MIMDDQRDDQREPPRDARREILVGPLVRIGLLRGWALRDHFIRLAILPLIGRMAIWPTLLGLVPSLQAGASDGRSGDTGLLMQAFLLGLCYEALGALFAVNWIRQLTLGASSTPGLGFGLSMRHLRFFLALAGITLAVFLPVFMIVLPVFMFVLGSADKALVAAIVMGSLVWLALLARLSPAWIGIAIDARMRLSTAWSRTRGQGFKLLLALLAVEIGVILVDAVVSHLLGFAGLAEHAPYAFFFINQAIDLIGLAAMIAVLVTAFPHFLRETV